MTQGSDAIKIARDYGHGALADEVEVRPAAVIVMSLP
jgi:hypothetical protein